MTEHTYKAWRDAPTGAWGVVMDHSPNHEPAGCYPTEQDAQNWLQAVMAAQPGTIGWTVQK